MKRLTLAVILATVLIPLLIGPASAGWEGKFADDSNCVAVNPRIDLDGVMYPQIAHYDVSNQSLKHVFYDGGNWNSTLIDPGHSQTVSGLIHDINGVVHLAYVRDDGLGYGVFNAGIWSYGQILSNLNGGEASAALAVDYRSAPHMAYAANLPGGVMYLTYSGNRLVAEELGMAGTEVAVGASSAGDPVVAFVTLPGKGREYGHLVCARKVGGSWDLEAIDTGVQVYGGIDLEVDVAGRIHIVYRSYTDGEIRHAFYDGYNWGLQMASGNAGSTGIQRIATDSEGNPHIVFSTVAGQTGVLRYAYRDGDGSSWLNEDITTGIDADITVDPLGRPHIAHGQSAGDRVPPPWPVKNCAVLKYAIRK